MIDCKIVIGYSIFTAFTSFVLVESNIDPQFDPSKSQKLSQDVLKKELYLQSEIKKMQDTVYVLKRNLNVSKKPAGKP